MIKSYLKTVRTISSVLAILLVTIGYSQEVHFTFENSQNTNDGANDFYEVDVMIQTINTSGTFKLGSGQLYFNYNTDAFGPSVSTSGGFEVSFDTASGYICGQEVDAAAIAIYGSFGQNDNTTSKVSWNFAQTFSSSTFAADNVTDTPTKLAHLKIQYVDVLEDPMVMFEEGVAFDDQFFTACGSAAVGPFETADCTGFAGVQVLVDTFDSAGAAVLSGPDIAGKFDLKIYPNPASDVINIRSSSNIDLVEMYDLLGKKVLSSTRTEGIMVSQLPVGFYVLNAYSERGKVTKKVIIE